MDIIFILCATNAVLLIVQGYIFYLLFVTIEDLKHTVKKLQDYKEFENAARRAVSLFS